jgi:SAM-dependent methyltransferase
MNLVQDFYRHEEGLRRLIRDLAREPDSLMLDVGCRKGEITRTLAEDKRFIAAVDIRCFPEWQESSPRVAFASADALALPFRDRTFDLVVSGECLQYVADWKRVLDEFQRVLKPQGRLVLSCPNGNPWIDGLDVYNLSLRVKRLLRPSAVRGRPLVRHVRPRQLLRQQSADWHCEKFLRRGSLGFIYASWMIDNLQNVRMRLASRGGPVRRVAAGCLRHLIRVLCMGMRLDFMLSLGGLSYNAIYSFRKKPVA